MSFQEVCEQEGVVEAIAGLCQFYCNKTFVVIDAEASLYDATEQMTLHLQGGYETIRLQFGEQEVILDEIGEIFELGCLIAQELDNNTSGYKQVFDYCNYK